MKKLLLLCGSLLLVNLLFAQQWITSGNNIYNGLPGYVGIGTGPSFPLDVAGTIHTTAYFLADIQLAGAAGVLVRGASSGIDANLILQGGGGSTFYLSGSSNILKIGGNGSSEPTLGAINIDNTGHVGVGTTNTAGYMFAVAGPAVFTQAVVKLQGNWPDYVFNKNYSLPSLESVAAYIKTNHHLPCMPAAAEVAEKGLDLGATQAKLLEKIEQLTLYTIELQQQVDKLKAENEKFARLQQQIDELKKSVR